MEKSKLTEEIKGLALQSGAKCIGIASSEAIDEIAPKGYRTQDILKEAKSVIVLGGHAVLAGAWQSSNNRINALTRGFPHKRKAMVQGLAEHIENTYGYYAIYFDGLPMEAGHTPFLSLKLCAEMAGLGSRAMAGGVVLNKDYGLLNFAVVVTTMPLDTDSPLEEAVCPDKSCIKRWESGLTTPCLSACPSCLEGELEDGKIKWMRYHRHRCAPGAMTTSLYSFQKILLEAINEEEKEKRKGLLLGEFFGRNVGALTSGTETVANCFECLRNCPIVRKGQRLQPKV